MKLFGRKTKKTDLDFNEIMAVHNQVSEMVFALARVVGVSPEALGESLTALRQDPLTGSKFRNEIMKATLKDIQNAWDKSQKILEEGLKDETIRPS